MMHMHHIRMTQVQSDPMLRPAPTERIAASHPGAATPGRLATSTRRLLEGRIAVTLLSLAAPTVIVMVIQAVVSAAEAPSSSAGWAPRRWPACPWSFP
jgi:hypothetical protein